LRAGLFDSVRSWIRLNSERFAAKEACAKALGTGTSNSVHWLDIEIKNDELRAPHIALAGGALRRAKKALASRQQGDFSPFNGHRGRDRNRDRDP
jgi:holo-[acyl-carrier-protein] synthase